MKRTKRNAVKSKQEIIEKAAPIFNKYGYAGTKMDMIIKATGYQKGGIYCHFDSKMDLARAAFRHNFSLLKAPYDTALNQAISPKKRLLAFVKAFKKYVTNPPIQGGCPLLNMAVESDDTDETNRLLVKEAFNEWKVAIEEVLINGIQLGEFNQDINVQQEAIFIIASIEGSIMIGQLKRSVQLMLGVADSLEWYIRHRIFLSLE